MSLAEKYGTVKSFFAFFAAAAALSMTIFLLSAAAFAPPALAIEGPKGGKLLFTFDDPAYDDYGPGYYSYPLGSLYKSNRKMFDVRRLRIYEVGDFYRFDVEYAGKIVRSWPGFPGQRNGWIMNIAEIYIDTDHKWGSGHRSAILGRNLLFYPECQWEKVVFISPMSTEFVRSAIRYKTDSLEFVDTLSDFVFPVNIDVYDYALSATVRKSDLGEFSPRWGFQLMSSVHDDTSSYMTFYNRQIFKSQTDDNFGGGTDFFGAPNVLDVLVPKGQSQKEILSRYKDHPNFAMAEFAKVPCVYDDAEAARQEAPLAAARRPQSGDAEKNLDLSLNDNFSVKEKVLEVSKPKDLAPAAPESAKSADAARNAETAPAPSSVPAGTATPVAAASTTASAAQKAKQIKNKSDKNNYDDFIKNLGDRKKKNALYDENDTDFDDVETFLKKDTRPAKIKTKAAKKTDKLEGFDSGVYDMARIDAPAEIKTGKAAKKNSGNVKSQAAPATPAVEAAQAPAAEPPAAAVEEAREDKSILGRLFKKKKPNKADPKAISEAVKALDFEDEQKDTESAATELKLNMPASGAAAGESSPGACGSSMAKVREAARAYLAGKPGAQKISMNMLVASGKLKEPLRCPEGGRYLIEITEKGPEISCINVNGTGHGKLK